MNALNGVNNYWGATSFPVKIFVSADGLTSCNFLFTNGSVQTNVLPPNMHIELWGYYTDPKAAWLTLDPNEQFRSRCGGRCGYETGRGAFYVDRRTDWNLTTSFQSRWVAAARPGMFNCSARRATDRRALLWDDLKFAILAGICGVPRFRP